MASDLSTASGVAHIYVYVHICIKIIACFGPFHVYGSLAVISYPPTFSFCPSHHSELSGSPWGLNLSVSVLSSYVAVFL